MYVLNQMSQVYCDAFIVDSREHLLFASLWGRDTAIQQLRAMLTLPNHEGGIRTLSIEVDSLQSPAKSLAHLSNIDDLTYLSGRVQTERYGELVNFWLYDPLLVKPDLATQRGFFLRRDTDELDLELDYQLIWPLLKLLCPLPMCDTWIQVICSEFIKHGWVRAHSGIGMKGYEIDLKQCESGALITAEQCIVQLIKSGQLT